MSATDSLHAGPGEQPSQLGGLFAQLPDLNQAREARGLSMQDVVELSGQSRTTVWRIFSGNVGVRLNSVLAVLNVLNLPFPTHDAQEFIRERELPLHPLYQDAPLVQETLERAAAAATQILDELFAGANVESAGINSNFQGLLKDHLEAMLVGKRYHRGPFDAGLNRLVYTEAAIGGPAYCSADAAGWVLRLEGTDEVLRGPSFRHISRFPSGEAFISREAAVTYFLERYLPAEGHPPGPISAEPVYYLDDESLQVGFTAPPTALGAE